MFRSECRSDAELESIHYNKLSSLHSQTFVYNTGVEVLYFKLMLASPQISK